MIGGQQPECDGESDEQWVPVQYPETQEAKSDRGKAHGDEASYKCGGAGDHSIPQMKPQSISTPAPNAVSARGMLRSVLGSRMRSTNSRRLLMVSKPKHSALHNSRCCLCRKNAEPRSHAQ